MVVEDPEPEPVPELPLVVVGAAEEVEEETALQDRSKTGVVLRVSPTIPKVGDEGASNRV